MTYFSVIGSVNQILSPLDVPILDSQKYPKYGTDTHIPTQQANTQYTYPKAVIFILCSKFFESFAANGVRSKLLEFETYERKMEIFFLNNFSCTSSLLKRFTELLGRFFHISPSHIQLFQSILSDYRSYNS